MEYVNGTKIESKANKYTFVCSKSVEKTRARLQEKIQALLGQICDVIALDKAAEAERVEFTPESLKSRIVKYNASEQCVWGYSLKSVTLKNLWLCQN